MAVAHPLQLNNAVPHLFSMKYLPCIKPSHCSTDRRWLRAVLPRTWLGSEEEKKREKSNNLPRFFGLFLGAKTRFASFVTSHEFQPRISRSEEQVLQL